MYRPSPSKYKDGIFFLVIDGSKVRGSKAQTLSTMVLKLKASSDAVTPNSFAESKVPEKKTAAVALRNPVPQQVNSNRMYT